MYGTLDYQKLNEPQAAFKNKNNRAQCSEVVWMGCAVVGSAPHLLAPFVSAHVTE